MVFGRCGGDALSYLPGSFVFMMARRLLSFYAKQNKKCEQCSEFIRFVCVQEMQDVRMPVIPVQSIIILFSKLLLSSRRAWSTSHLIFGTWYLVSYHESPTKSQYQSWTAGVTRLCYNRTHIILVISFMCMM